MPSDPDPARPILVRFTEEERDVRKLVYQQKAKLVEDCDLDRKIMPLIEQRMGQVWRFNR